MGEREKGEKERERREGGIRIEHWPQVVVLLGRFVQTWVGVPLVCEDESAILLAGHDTPSSGRGTGGTRGQP